MTLVDKKSTLFFKSQIVALAAMVLLLVAASLTSCASVKLTKIGGETMGTVYSVSIASDEAIDEQKLKTEVDRLLVDFNRIFSTYDPTSEISLLNGNLSKGALGLERNLPLSAAMAQQLKRALELAEYTKGSFDPTVKPLIDLWGFSRRDNPEDVPSNQAISSAMERVGYQRVEMSADNQAKFYSGMAIDFSAIAKGRAVDEVAELLVARGFADYLVDIGGEVAVSGANASGSPWRVMIATPQGGDQDLQGEIISAPLDAEGQRFAVATSGDYMNYFEKEGVRYSHLIDPTKGTPITHRLASVTVVAETCEDADALATGLYVLGEVAGLEFAEKHGIAAFFIWREQAYPKPVDNADKASKIDAKNQEYYFETSASSAFSSYTSE